MGRRYRSQLYVVGAAAAIGIAIGIAAALIHTSHSPAAARPSPLQAQITWREDAKPAPGLALRDQTGASIALRSLRGHVVLLTFLDSQCKRECPIEGRVIHDVLRRVEGTRAVTVVVSVGPLIIGRRAGVSIRMTRMPRASACWTKLTKSPSVP